MSSAIIVLVVVVHIFLCYQALEAHRGSGDCYVHVFIQPCFHGSPMHTWCSFLSPSTALSTVYSTQAYRCTSRKHTYIILTALNPTFIQ